MKWEAGHCALILCVLITLEENNSWSGWDGLALPRSLSAAQNCSFSIRHTIRVFYPFSSAEAYVVWKQISDGLKYTINLYFTKCSKNENDNTFPIGKVKNVPIIIIIIIIIIVNVPLIWKFIIAERENLRNRVYLCNSMNQLNFIPVPS